MSSQTVAMDNILLYMLGMLLLCIAYGILHSKLRSSIYLVLGGFLLGLVVGAQLLIAVESGNITRWVTSALLHVVTFVLMMVLVKPRA